MAICQAIDLLPEDEKGKLSTKTQQLYKEIRKICPFLIEDVPVFEEMANIYIYLHSNDLK